MFVNEITALAEVRYGDLLREAETERLARQAQGRMLNPVVLVLALFGRG